MLYVGGYNFIAHLCHLTGNNVVSSPLARLIWLPTDVTDAVSPPSKLPDLSTEWKTAVPNKAGFKGQARLGLL